METTPASAPAVRAESGRFPLTHWSVIRDAGEGSSPDARAAFGQLYETYHPALLAFLRGWGNPPDKAEDLLQGFFTKLLSSDALGTVQRQGEFRNWLLRCLKNYLRDRHRHDEARIHSPKEAPLPIGETNETGCVQPVSRELAADREYDRQFALAFLGDVMTLLEEEYAARRKKVVFDALLPLLHDKKAESSHAALGAVLGLTENAVNQEICRLRKRYRELFKVELSRLCGADHFEEEKRQLFAALTR